MSAATFFWFLGIMLDLAKGGGAATRKVFRRVQAVGDGEAGTSNGGPGRWRGTRAAVGDSLAPGIESSIPLNLF